ncbi:hypothetical protein FACS1894156_7840 [Bacteroidia bacterium]|nr:hypothetical protein FACS1894156_7840 [Bacteroidia bacterium]
MKKIDILENNGLIQRIVDDSDSDGDNRGNLNVGDTVRLSFGRIQKGYYNFILQCQDEKEGGSSFFSSPASNINTNISNGGIGYFSCYSVTVAETIVKND